ncbi:MAG: hypothetical protein ACREVS_08075, partial [Burkholderiales bacterium]
RTRAPRRPPPPGFGRFPKRPPKGCHADGGWCYMCAWPGGRGCCKGMKERFEPLGIKIVRGRRCREEPPPDLAGGNDGTLENARRMGGLWHGSRPPIRRDPPPRTGAGSVGVGAAPHPSGPLEIISSANKCVACGDECYLVCVVGGGLICDKTQGYGPHYDSLGVLVPVDVWYCKGARTKTAAPAGIDGGVNQLLAHCTNAGGFKRRTAFPPREPPSTLAAARRVGAQGGYQPPRFNFTPPPTPNPPAAASAPPQAPTAPEGGPEFCVNVVGGGVIGVGGFYYELYKSLGLIGERALPDRSNCPR